MEAKSLLMLVTLSLGLLGVVFAQVWFWRTRSPFDWVERWARSCFVGLQCMLWGSVVAFTVLSQSGIHFGGTK